MMVDFRGSVIAAVLGDWVYVLTDVLRYLSLWVVLLFYCSFGVCVLNVDLTFFFLTILSSLKFECGFLNRE